MSFFWPWPFAARSKTARETTHEPPTTLDEWERLLRFSVLCYGAYFEALLPAGPASRRRRRRRGFARLA